MTFQGDVGGIGLADLLQSLARGRDGILTLIGRGGLQATLGIEGGALHLLADPSEDPDLWRDRARAAWIGDPHSRIDSVRMTEIARAHRIEIVYQLFDADTVHFRFVPGPLPKPPEEAAISRAETGFSRPASRRDAVWCAPVPVEALLLEYARLKDEAAGLGQAFFLSPQTVLFLVDPNFAQGELARFAAECDGTSSLLEIADRLGWALRQMRITTAVAILRGMLRGAQAGELLTLAQRELLAGNTERAASRLVGWHETSPPGPIAEQDADFLVHEWNAGRLQGALRRMPAPAARAVLRRVDSAVFNPLASAERWKEFAEYHTPDAISKMRILVCQIRSGAEGSMPAVRDLLAVARSLNERRQCLRAAAFLRIAAARQPETSSSRIDLGLGFLNAGLPDEGAPWILDAAQTLIDEHLGEKVVQPLRTLVEANPSNREARRLLSRARAGAMRRKLTGRHALLIAAAGCLLLVTAWVAMKSKRETERRLAAVAERLPDPVEALALLEREFPDDLSVPVQKLRTAIVEARRTSDLEKRNAWSTTYREALVECNRGDPLDGLRKVLGLPPVPELLDDKEPWPLVSALFEELAARCEQVLRDLGSVPDDEKSQAHAELRASKLFSDLRAALAGHEENAHARDFEKRLLEFDARIATRAEQRAAERAARVKKENQAKQDLFLAEARAHAQAGDHIRSLAAYRQILDLDETGKLRTILAPEIQAEEKRTAAIQKARDLATQGKHQEAHKALDSAIENGGDYLLPWRLESVPSGARARFSNGSVRVTPINLETAFGEKISMTIEKDGCEPVTLEVDTPADRTVYLTRAPERWWHAKGRVDALPLAIGTDHVVCDRSGTIVRMTHGGKIVWQQKLSSLGGIARTPAFMPRQRGRLLVLTEDGEAWLCDSATGALEGPVELGSPPMAGPTQCADGIRARLRDGRNVLWTDSLAPDTSPGNEADPATENVETAADGQMVVLRRAASGSLTLKSPWTGWTAEVGDKACMLRARNEDKPSVSLRRDGAWTYMAWEAPHAQIPNGRLWIADGLGLRSYAP